MKIIKSKDLARYSEEYMALCHARSIAYRDYVNVLADPIRLTNVEEDLAKVDDAMRAYHEADSRVTGYMILLAEKVLF